MMGMIEDENGGLVSPPIHGWFGLTYANYLVIPRLALQEMPLDWQRRMVALLEEWEAAGIKTPSYYVLRDDPEYTRVERVDPDDDYSRIDEYHVLQEDEWANYRRGSVAAVSLAQEPR